jgi:hypothetical protein
MNHKPKKGFPIKVIRFLNATPVLLILTPSFMRHAEHNKTLKAQASAVGECREKGASQVSTLTAFLPGLPPVLARFLLLRGSPECSRFPCVCPVRSNLISGFDS